MDAATFSPLLENALQQPDRWHALVELARHCSSLGLKRKAIEDLFLSETLRLRAENREADDDLILDLLDCINGWGKRFDFLDYSDT